MAYPIDLLLTNTNYFQWKYHRKDLLRSKGMYHITLGKEEEPIDDDKHVKWINRNDEAHGIIRMSISHDLRFHLQGLDAPNKAWEKFEFFFCKHNLIQSHQIENQIMNLSPNDFSCIEYYLSMFKTLIILCEECRIKLDNEHCIYIILTTLGSPYSLFVSTFYATRESLGISYQKPTLESFGDALIRYKDNLVQLGVISTAGTSNKALVAQQKDKSKNPKKKHPHYNNKQNKGLKPTQPASAPNGDTGEKSKNKKTNRHCNFCGKYGHDESKCFKKMTTL
jgi:hypothetical protein